MKYRVIKNSDTLNLTIVVEDGGIASAYDSGDEVITEYYGHRLDEIDGEDVWNELSNGKMYIKGWEDHRPTEEELIADALDWLVFPAPKKWELDNNIYSHLNLQ